MSIFIKQLVKRKLKGISYDDILYFSKQYDFSITESEARKIAVYVRENDLDPFDLEDRNRMFNMLSTVTSKETALNAEKLLMQLIKSYGLEHLF